MITHPSSNTMPRLKGLHEITAAYTDHAARAHSSGTSKIVAFIERLILKLNYTTSQYPCARYGVDPLLAGRVTSTTSNPTMRPERTRVSGSQTAWLKPSPPATESPCGDSSRRRVRRCRNSRRPPAGSVSTIRRHCASHVRRETGGRQRQIVEQTTRPDDAASAASFRLKCARRLGRSSSPQARRAAR